MKKNIVSLSEMKSLSKKDIDLIFSILLQNKLFREKILLIKSAQISLFLLIFAVSLYIMHKKYKILFIFENK